MMIPVNSENGNHNRRPKERYFKIISINGNKPACAGDGVPDTASVKIGYIEQRQPNFRKIINFLAPLFSYAWFLGLRG
jgi:hypothetical protein